MKLGERSLRSHDVMISCSLPSNMLRTTFRRVVSPLIIDGCGASVKSGMDLRSELLTFPRSGYTCRELTRHKARATPMPAHKSWLLRELSLYASWVEFLTPSKRYQRYEYSGQTKELLPHGFGRAPAASRCVLLSQSSFPTLPNIFHLQARNGDTIALSMRHF